MILLDTCAFIWDALQHDKLSKGAKQIIQQGDRKGQLMICDITLWEVAMLIKRKRLQLEISAESFCQLALQARTIDVIPINPTIAELSVNLDSNINNDPADRLITATAIHLGATLITADRNLRESPLLESVW